MSNYVLPDNLMYTSSVQHTNNFLEFFFKYTSLYRNTELSLKLWMKFCYVRKEKYKV